VGACQLAGKRNFPTIFWDVNLKKEYKYSGTSEELSRAKDVISTKPRSSAARVLFPTHPPSRRIKVPSA
jgi:hypothetical protein